MLWFAFVAVVCLCCYGGDAASVQQQLVQRGRGNHPPDGRVVGLEAAPSRRHRHLDVKVQTKGGGPATSVLVPMYDDDENDDDSGSSSLSLVDSDLTAAAVGTTELSFLLRKITELKAELDRRKLADAEHGLLLKKVAQQADTRSHTDEETVQLRRRVAELAQRAAAAGVLGSENTALRSKISNLTVQSRRADELRREVDTLRKELKGVGSAARHDGEDGTAAKAAATAKAAAKVATDLARERDELADKLRQAEAALAADRARLEAYETRAASAGNHPSRDGVDENDKDEDEEVGLMFDWEDFLAWAHVCGSLVALHLAVTAFLTARETRRAAAAARADLAVAAALAELEGRNEQLHEQVRCRGAAWSRLG